MVGFLIESRLKSILVYCKDRIKRFLAIACSTQSITIVLFVCFVLVLDRNLAKITGVVVWMP